jgi:amino acid transporter
MAQAEIPGDSTQPETGLMVAETELQAGALGLGSLIAQSLTHIAPAMGFLTGATFIATYAGTAIPLAYLLAFLVCLTIALSLIQLAKHLPSAGGYFTYVSRTLSPRFGFITAWLYFLYDPTVAAINFAIIGVIFEQVLKDRAGITFPWWATVLLGTILVVAIMYRGVQISGKIMIVLAAIEVAILLIFSLAGVFSPGPGGVSAIPFQLDANYPIDKLFVGVVFAIFAFTGFEAVAPMAEESENPRRYLPRAILISLSLMGLFYVIAAWGLVIGWGTDIFDTEFAGGSVSTFMDLAVRLFGSWGWILLFLAILNSGIAVGIAGGNAATRVWFSMGRGGALPRWLGYVHPRYKTPTHAILLYGVITLALALGGSWLFGYITNDERGFAPDTLFFWFGLAITLGLIGVYGLGNIGVIRFYLTERRAEFNIFWHLIIPVISTIAILVVGYYSLQGLVAPYIYAPMFVAVWVVVGIVILIFARLTGREQWFLKAGEVAYERQATPEEVAGSI